jgi:hypothetical protein
MADLAISAPAMKGLLSLEKKELARRVLELHDLLARERANRELPEPVDAFGAHLAAGSLGWIGDREIGPGHVILSRDRYWWLFERAGLRMDNLLAHRGKPVRDADLPAVGSFHG